MHDPERHLGTERARTVRGKDLGRIGKGEESQQRRALFACESFGRAGRDEIRATDRLDQEAAAGEERDRTARFFEREGHVVERMAGRVQRTHHDARPDFDDVAVANAAIGIRDMRLRGLDDHRARAFVERETPGDEIVVNVRIERMGDRRARRFGSIEIRPDVTLGIDDRSTAPLHVDDHIGAVADAVGCEFQNLHVGRLSMYGFVPAFVALIVPRLPPS